MNCSRCRDAMLLAESGEPKARDARAVDAHLATCADCCSFKADLETLSRVAHEAVPADRPAPAVLARIRGEAAAAVPGSVIPFVPVARVLAYAALVAALIGGWLMWQPGDASPELQNMHALVSLVMEQDEGESMVAGDRDEASLRALAEQLLIMEGLTDENGGDDLDLLIPAELPPPTADQWRSTPGSRSTERV